MKKIFKLITNLYILVLLLAATGCSDNNVEPLFDKSINERTEALKTEYLNILTAPENGWIGYYSPNKTFGAYTMLMDFNTDGSVKINSDYDQGAEDNSITYRLDKTLKIELVLETFAVFHKIFEIGNNDNQGEFVFNILSATEDEVVLESKLDYGDDITIFTLRRATPDQLNLMPVYESVENVAGDGTESVFRNILLNDQVIGTFNFNPVTRLTTISYINDKGVVIKLSVAIAISSTGFNFLEPLDINGNILTNFTFDETKDEYVNDADGLRIIYDNLPGLPLDTFNFGVSHEAAVINLDELSKQSLGFNNFYDDFSNTIANDLDLPGLQITNIIFWDLNTGAVPYLNVRTNYGAVNYDLDVAFDEQTGIVTFSIIGTDAPAFFTAIIQPLLDVLIGSSKGYYSVKTGTYLNFPNKTVGLINADDPSFQIDYWTF